MQIHDSLLAGTQDACLLISCTQFCDKRGTPRNKPVDGCKYHSCTAFCRDDNLVSFFFISLKQRALDLRFAQWLLRILLCFVM